jgi:glutathione S-transferase
MKLFYADLSPYARKVRVVIAEKGLADRVQLVPVVPYDIPEELSRANPLSKVPTLVTDGGKSLFDSPVICEYLDVIGGGRPLVPASGDARWDTLRRVALADGVIDYAFNIAGEVYRRPENERSPKWIAHWVAAIARSVEQLEKEIGEWPAEMDMGHVGLGVALAYLDIRIKDHLDWRAGHPKLAAWYESFARRPSMTGSAPKL